MRSHHPSNAHVGLREDMVTWFVLTGIDHLRWSRSSKSQSAINKILEADQMAVSYGNLSPQRSKKITCQGLVIFSRRRSERFPFMSGGLGVELCLPMVGVVTAVVRRHSPPIGILSKPWNRFGAKFGIEQRQKRAMPLQCGNACPDSSKVNVGTLEC